MRLKAVNDFLEEKAEYYNSPAFIEEDPIALPHAFDSPIDIEIVGLFAAIMAWGQRKTILNKGHELIKRMDHQPSEFVRKHEPTDLAAFDDFAHRTLQPRDVKGILGFLQQHYQTYDSLEALFLNSTDAGEEPLEQGLTQFHQSFVSYHELPARAKKHIASPAKKAACKRLNMFLRWMVRQDANGVDFGIWQRIEPANLFCPLDVHVARVARKLGLLQRQQADWNATLALTQSLRELDPKDPIKYDFALFGLGIEGFPER